MPASALAAAWSSPTAAERAGPDVVGGFAPTVRLVRAESSGHPFALTVAAAKSCYAARPVSVEDVAAVFDPAADAMAAEELEERRERAAELYRGLVAAGHHTTLQHASFVFVLDGVSRLAIWSFLHAHPFYNSEQVSQRYREVTGHGMVTPPLAPAQLAVYRAAVDRALAGYRRLVALLTPEMARRYAAVFPVRTRSPRADVLRRVRADVRRRAQEVARSVLPLATPAHLYHTVNGLTLLRYHALAGQLDAPGEVRALVDRMVAEVLALDPNFLGAPGHPLDVRPLLTEETLEHRVLRSLGDTLRGAADEAFFREFDAALEGRSSRLVAATPNAERLLADAVRTVLGRTRAELPDERAIAAVLSPRENPYLGHALNPAMHSKLMQTLAHVQLTFQKRIAGAEAAQNQRHRGTPTSPPILLAHLRRQPDVIPPRAIAEHAAAREEFEATVGALWAAKNRLLELGARPEDALYLLPNAHAVRFHESGSLLNYLWKWTKRLCFAAQREIFDTTVEEVAQVAAAMPTIGRHIGPPCVLRAGAGRRPCCPEGDRFCGVPVWRDYRLETLPSRRVL